MSTSSSSPIPFVPPSNDWQKNLGLPNALSVGSAGGLIKFKLGNLTGSGDSDKTGSAQFVGDRYQPRTDHHSLFLQPFKLQLTRDSAILHIGTEEVFRGEKGGSRDGLYGTFTGVIDACC